MLKTCTVRYGSHSNIRLLKLKFKLIKIKYNSKFKCASDHMRLIAPILDSAAVEHSIVAEISTGQHCFRLWSLKVLLPVKIVTNHKNACGISWFLPSLEKKFWCLRNTVCRRQCDEVERALFEIEDLDLRSDLNNG